jgi:hypothetical protein
VASATKCTRVDGTNRKLLIPPLTHAPEQIAAEIGVHLHEARAEVRGIS